MVVMAATFVIMRLNDTGISMSLPNAHNVEVGKFIDSLLFSALHQGLKCIGTRRYCVLALLRKT